MRGKRVKRLRKIAAQTDVDYKDVKKLYKKKQAAGEHLWQQRS